MKTYLVASGTYNDCLYDILIEKEIFEEDDLELADYFPHGTEKIELHGEVEVTGEAVGNMDTTYSD